MCVSKFLDVAYTRGWVIVSRRGFRTGKLKLYLLRTKGRALSGFLPRVRLYDRDSLLRFGVAVTGFGVGVGLVVLRPLDVASTRGWVLVSLISESR